MIVAMIKAFVEWLSLPLGEYDIAKLAFSIERVDAGLAGGKQDQYAATVGGFNFMEFNGENAVINPLRIKNWIKDELQCSSILYFLGNSRSSAKIILEQQKNTQKNLGKQIEAMHAVKESSFRLKEALLKGDMASFTEIMRASWKAKKGMANKISNDRVERFFKKAFASGVKAGKLSGAGGGGFALLLVDPDDRIKVVNQLNGEGGQVFNFIFTEDGCHGWRI